MTGKAVSYQFLDVLAKSVGMDVLAKTVGMDALAKSADMAALAESAGVDAETVKQALAEINRLQQQTQALELAVQGKAPTSHASRQPIFGAADEQMYGHVKIAHEVAKDSTGGVAVSPDAVYAYAKPVKTTAQKRLTVEVNGTIDGLNPVYYANGIIISGYLSFSGSSDDNVLIKIKGFNAAQNAGQISWIVQNAYSVYGENWFIDNVGNDFQIRSGTFDKHPIEVKSPETRIGLMLLIPGNLTE